MLAFLNNLWYTDGGDVVATEMIICKPDKQGTFSYSRVSWTSIGYKEPRSNVKQKNVKQKNVKEYYCWSIRLTNDKKFEEVVIVLGCHPPSSTGPWLLVASTYPARVPSQVSSNCSGSAGVYTRTEWPLTECQDPVETSVRRLEQGSRGP